MTPSDSSAFSDRGLTTRMKCIVHIGANKTGTSSIQRTLARHDSQLREQGAIFPSAGRVFGDDFFERHIGLRFAATPLSQPLKGLATSLGMEESNVRSEYREKFRESLWSELRESSFDTAVISDEALFVFSSASVATGVKKLLSEFFTEIEVIAYLRRPDLFICSEYSQSVKTGYQGTLSEYINKNIRNEKYYERLHPWQDAFGRNNVKVRCFDKKILVNGDAVDDFINASGLEANKFNRYRVNESLSVLGCETLRLINKHFKGNTPRYFRGAVSSTMNGPGPKLNAEELDLVRQAYAPDHEKLIAAFGLTEGRDFYSLDEMTIQTQDANVESAEQMARCLIRLANRLSSQAKSTNGRE